MWHDGQPELSVIVPVLDEEREIGRFLDGLALQREARIEVLICDGGSTDGSLAQARKLSDRLPFPVRIIEGPRGRAFQMNRGAAAARAETLLFLHVDSSFPDPLSLRKGLDLLNSATAGADTAVAARFSLEFLFPGSIPLPYRFYGAKARLDRPGCTHGDQGFLLPARFFSAIGPFDTSLPLMEDTFLAERVRGAGKWLLIPARIRTSPRRFLEEGLLERQSLNAILMNLTAAGRLEMIRALKESYRSQGQTRRLNLLPFFKVLEREVAALPREERRRFWYETGSYVRSNAWQIPFCLDFLLGLSAKGRLLLFLHDRVLGRVIDNRVGNWIAAGLTWCWYKAMLRSSQGPCSVRIPFPK